MAPTDGAASDARADEQGAGSREQGKTADRRPQTAETRPSDHPGTPGREAEEVPGGDSVENDLNALSSELRAERDQYLDLARRAKADYENFRKRAARDAAEAEKRGRAGLARQIVPSLDSLERALEVAENGSEVARGIELVHAEVSETLARAGVEAYDPTGESFDPSFHEAVATAAAGDGDEPGSVIRTLERGYRLDGQVIRPARVVVGE